MPLLLPKQEKQHAQGVQIRRTVPHIGTEPLSEWFLQTKAVQPSVSEKAEVQILTKTYKRAIRDCQKQGEGAAPVPGMH